MVLKLKVRQNKPLHCLIFTISSPLIWFHLHNSMGHASPFCIAYVKTDEKLSSPDL